MKSLNICLILLAYPLILSAQVKKMSADKEISFISYYMEHPAHAWTATSKAMTCNIAYDEKNYVVQQVGVSVMVESFDSQNSSRDSHALEVLEAIKYPKLTFLSSNIVQDGSQLTITGTLTFHNVSKTISFVANLEDGDKEMRITGNFAVKLTDYDIERPTLLLVPVKDEIQINFKMYFWK